MTSQLARGTPLIAVIAFLTAQPAAAGGLWLNELGDFSGGRASAGAAAGTGDAGGILHNPAGATGVKSGELFASAGYIAPRVRLDIDESHRLLGDDNGGSQVGVGSPTASFAYVSDFGLDRWAFGFSTAGLAGSGLDYNDDWVGRYQATDVSLLVMTAAFTVAYEVTDRLSIGIAPQLYYADLEMELNTPNLRDPRGPDSRLELNGDDDGFGYLAGMTYQLTDRSRLGLSYQSELDIKFDGDLKVKRGGDPDALRQSESNTEMPMAENVRAAWHYDLSDALGLDFTVGWDHWQALDKLIVSVDAVGGAAGLPTHWDDTYHYAAGFQYAVDPYWDLTAGIAYDTSPVNAKDRTASLPVDEQIRYNVGLRCKQSDRLVIGGYLNYTDLGDARIRASFWSGEFARNEVISGALFVNWQL